MLIDTFADKIPKEYTLLHKVEDKNVYFVEDKKFNKFVVKFIDKEDYDGHLYDLLSKINIDPIPRMVNRQIHEDYVMIVRTYMVGRTLYDIIEESGPLKEDQALKYFKMLAEALDHIHHIDTGIIYRDIQPKNVILHKDKVYLIDLDSARKFKKKATNDTIAIGVIGFIAPEQYGFDQSSVQSDIYSLGVLMTYMLTGLYPTFNNNQVSLDTTALSKPLKKLLKAMTSFDKKRRPKTMGHVLDIIHRFSHLKYRKVALLLGIIGFLFVSFSLKFL